MRRAPLLAFLLSAPLLASAQGAASGVWRVAGTLVGGTQSRVLLENKAGAQRRLRVGDAVDGCTIREISAGGLQLSCGENTHWLPLQDSGRLLPVARSAPLSAVLPDQAFRELLRQQQRLVSEISLKPRVRNGRMDGYAVERLKPGGLLEGHGLIAGDVIVAVNGSLVSQPQGFMNTLQQLGSAPDFLLQLEHDGLLRELQVRLR